jgi:hypothetical protein
MALLGNAHAIDGVVFGYSDCATVGIKLTIDGIFRSD